MAADDGPTYEGVDEPLTGIEDAHRWYRFTLPGGAPARVGITTEAAQAWMAGTGEDEDALDAWVVARGREVLAGRAPDAPAEVVLDVPPPGA